MKGIHAAFIIVKTSNREIKLSARSDGLVNVSTLCEKLGGGGHFTSAAAVFMKSDVKEVENMLLNVISLYLKDAKAEAQGQIDQLNQSIIAKEQEIEELKKQFEVYKAKMESLLISQLELLKDVNKD